MLEIRLLGQFGVRLDGQQLAVPSRAAQSLLAYLLLHPGSPHRRERLAGLLWPDTSDENARRNLRQELWRLRKALDGATPSQGDLIASDDLTIGIDRAADLWLDVAALERAGAAGSADELTRAVDAYRGDLLPGFYDEWAVLERERLRAVYERLSARLLDQLVSAQRWDEVRVSAERWIAHGTSPEPAYRALMSAHAALGDRSSVAATYERCRKALQDGLGVEPSEETRALYAELMAGERASSAAGMSLSPPRRSIPTVPTGDEPPYRGLRYFDEADADLFFGREALVATLVNQLRDHHVLAVVGASGSGKSSLVRAGLVPALKSNRTLRDNESTAWTIPVFTPSAHPLESLAVALTRAFPSPLATTALADELARDPRVLRVFLAKTIPKDSRVLLVIDQFEELFTLCRDDGERRSFVANLLNATAPELDQPIHLVVALRADFYAPAAQFASLRAALAQRQEFIGPLSQEEMRRAIEEPARRGGWVLEAGLVEALLRDAGDEPGALPLLSHALLETWKRRSERTLTLAGYYASGGVRGALAQTAEAVYASLSEPQQSIARNIFLRLTTLGDGTPDTRRRAPLSELSAGRANASGVETVLGKLADARLITLGEGTAEVAHEALIGEWSRLTEWLNQNREGLLLHRRLTEAAQAWQKSGWDAGELYRGARLAQATEWAAAHTDGLNPLERGFLEASATALAREEQEREAQRRRELEAAQRLAETERRRAEEQTVAARQLRVYAEQLEQERRTSVVRELSLHAINNLGVDPERSILLALHAVAMSTAGGKPVAREAEEALHRAVVSSRVRLTLRGHTLGVWGVAYSPDGGRLATASADKTAKIWDAVTGKELLTLSGHNRSVTSVAFSPDGKHLATSSSDQTAKVWDLATVKELLTLTGHTDEVRAVVFSPDGSRLATISSGRNFGGIDHTARVWDASTGGLLLTLVGHSEGIASVAFSPDSTRLATASYDRSVRLWDAITGQVLRTFTPHDRPAVLAFSPDGTRIATGSNDATQKVWDVTSGRLLLTLLGSTGLTRSIVFDPAGKRLAAGSAEGVANVWDATSGEMALTLAGNHGAVRCVAFSPDGSHLATSSNDGTAKIWDVTPAGSGEWRNLCRHCADVNNIAYSADGRRLATASRDNNAKVWDATTGQEILTISGHNDWVQDVAFSPDGKRLATSSADKTAKIWDAASGQTLLTLATQATSKNSPCLGVSFSPDGRRLAAVARNAGDVRDQRVKVYDSASGRELLAIYGDPLLVYGAAFSPDGMRLVTYSEDRTAKVWDSTTGKLLLTLSGHIGSVLRATFSPDGTRLATAGSEGTAKVWDAATGEELLTLCCHSGTALRVVFSPDGRRVATCSVDRTVKVWDIEPQRDAGWREEPLTLYHDTTVLAVAFSPDGNRLATAGRDGITRVWALPIEDVVAIAKTRVTRTLTQDECQKYLHVETCPPEP